MSESFTVKEVVVGLAEELKQLRQEVKQKNEDIVELKNIATQVLEQARLTNGRVTANTTNITALQNDHNRFKTIVATLSAVIGVVWTGITFFFK